MSETPSTHGIDGKDGRGRFAPGNKLGKGNPLAGRAAKIRAALLRASKPDDVREIVQKLIDGAKAGDLAFIREFFDRTIGKPAQTDVADRLERLEMLLAAREVQTRGRN